MLRDRAGNAPDGASSSPLVKHRGPSTERNDDESMFFLRLGAVRNDSFDLRTRSRRSGLAKMCDELA